MKHWTLCSLQKFLHQLTYPPFKFYSPSLHFLHSPKFIQACPKFSTHQQTNPILTFPEKGNATLTPSSYSRLLSQCCNNRCLKPLLQIHAHIAKFGLSDDLKLLNQLINIYSKTGALRYALKVFEEIPEPEVVSWTSLISGYAQNGLGEEALLAFRDMHVSGIRCNEFTFPSVFKACSITNDLVVGKQVHGIVLIKGFDFDIFVGNSLVVMYAKCGELLDSRRLFEETSGHRDVVTWNALFSSYVQSDLCGEAVDLFQVMVSSGIKPDCFSLSNIVNACAGSGNGVQGRIMHGYFVKLGYDSNPYCTNALVDMYSKVGDLKDAIVVFEEIEKPDIVSWNAVISGCFLHEYYDLGLEMLGQMKRSGLYPDMFTLSSALKGCARLGLKELGQQFHSLLIKMKEKPDLFATVALIDMYSKCDSMQDARMVYDSMPVKDLIAHNAMISGYSQNGGNLEALQLFTEMHKNGMGFDEMTLSTVLKSSGHSLAVIVCKQLHALCVKSGLRSDIYIINSLIDAYGKCGCVESAAIIFEGYGIRDVVSFTSMITAYAQYGLGKEALMLFKEMQYMGLKPDQFVCSALLNACANILAYEQGKQIHAQAMKLEFVSDIFAGNSLVNMYAKCGSIDDAILSFSEIPHKESVSWTAIIGGLAQHGRGQEALQVFDEMLKRGVSPSHVTMISVLYACNHAGLVNEAKDYFKSMKDLYGIEPTQEHYACMIDLMGRAGKLHEALELMSVMPFKANASIWGAILGASRRHKDVDLGQRAAEMLFKLEPDESGNHVLLANLYASAGRWDDVLKVRKLLKDTKVDKEPGMSCV